MTTGYAATTLELATPTRARQVPNPLEVEHPTLTSRVRGPESPRWVDYWEGASTVKIRSANRHSFAERTRRSS